MRPRERDQDPAPPESSPTPAAPPARLVGNLSSMVVRPADFGGGDGDDFDAGEVGNRRESPPRRRASPAMAMRRRRESPTGMDLGRRRDSPPPFRRRDSPVGFYRRVGGGGSPNGFRSRPQRFGDNPGYMPHAGSISPPPHRPKLNDDYEPEFDHPVGPRFGRGFRGGRTGGRFRDVSPHDGFGRGGRSLGRGHTLDRRRLSPSGGEYVHRNDPNLSPREGDWICGNPRAGQCYKLPLCAGSGEGGPLKSVVCKHCLAFYARDCFHGIHIRCGNLNFARRTYCNNCNKPRFALGHSGLSHSPRRDYFTSPPHGSPPSFADPPLDRGGVRREISSYRSPPRGWGTEGPRDFLAGSPPPRHVGAGAGAGARFQDHMRRDDRLEYEDDYRGRGKSDLPVVDDYGRRDGFIPGRRGYDRPPSPRDRWARGPRVRSRSRSPLGVRTPKRSYIGRGQVDRRYDSYTDRGRVDEPDLGRRGFHRDDDSFAGRGRGSNRRGMARGRINGDRY